MVRTKGTLYKMLVLEDLGPNQSFAWVQSAEKKINNKVNKLIEQEIILSTDSGDVTRDWTLSREAQYNIYEPTVFRTWRSKQDALEFMDFMKQFEPYFVVTIIEE
jgi:hypothetical protein